MRFNFVLTIVAIWIACCVFALGTWLVGELARSAG